MTALDVAASNMSGSVSGARSHDGKLGIATSSKGITTSSRKLLVTRASLL